MQEITNFAGGVIIGFGLAWMLERWVMSFVRRLSIAETEALLQENTKIGSKLFSQWGIYIGMTITAAALSEWRQWSHELLNDLILITALVGIAFFGLGYSLLLLALPLLRWFGWRRSNAAIHQRNRWRQQWTDWAQLHRDELVEKAHIQS